MIKNRDQSDVDRNQGMAKAGRDKEELLLWSLQDRTLLMLLLGP